MAGISGNIQGFELVQIIQCKPEGDTRTVVVRSYPLWSTSIVATPTSTRSHVNAVVGYISGVHDTVSQSVADITLLAKSKRELITHEAGGINCFREVKCNIANIHIQVIGCDVRSAHIFHESASHQGKAINDGNYGIVTHILYQLCCHGDIGGLLADKECIDSLHFIQIVFRKSDNDCLPIPRESIAVCETNSCPRADSTLQG